MQDAAAMGVRDGVAHVHETAKQAAQLESALERLGVEVPGQVSREQKPSAHSLA